MKKILHILVLPILAGSQKISLEILKNLPDSDYQKWVLFSNDPDIHDKSACEEAFKQAGVRVLYSDNLKRSIGLKDIPATIEIYKLCKQHKFDIVHTHSTKPGIIGRIAATLARVPLVVHTVHGLAFHKFIKFPRWQFYWTCEMFASLFCDRIVLVNKYYSRYFKWFKHKTVTVYNGVDYTRFRELPLSRDETVKVLFVGRLDTQKDPITLLKAAQIVLHKEPSVRFTLVGDGEQYAECEGFIKQNGLESNIRLEGWQSDVAPYYASHHLFAAPSIYESFGLMFVEAGYYKLPVAATNVEGIPEVVQNNITGLLCRPQDPETLSANILKLVTNSDQIRERMGQNAHQYVTHTFTMEKMVNGYLKIYTS